jgi:hypothetical protein
MAKVLSCFLLCFSPLLIYIREFGINKGLFHVMVVCILLAVLSTFVWPMEQGGIDYEN